MCVRAAWRADEKMVLAFILIMVQVILRIAFPVWLQIVGLSASVALSVRMYFAGERSEFTYARQLWLLDICVAIMLGLHYNLVPLVGSALVVPLLCWCMQSVTRNWMALSYRAVTVGMIILFIFLILLDCALVLFVYTNLAPSFLEKMLVPLVFYVGGDEGISVEPAIGSGDFAIGLFLHLYLGLPLCLFPLVFTVAAVAGMLLADLFVWQFPLLVTIVPVQFFAAILYTKVFSKNREKQRYYHQEAQT